MQIDEFENISKNLIRVSEACVNYQDKSFDKPCFYAKGEVLPFAGVIDVNVIDLMTVVLVVSNHLSLHDFHLKYKWPLEEKGVGSDLLKSEAFMAQQVILRQEDRPFIAVFL